MKICEVIGLKKENIRFCPEIEGPEGTGGIAKELQLTHFVENMDECVKAVFSDEAGNAGEFIRKAQGQLFHFKTSGGNSCPEAKNWIGKDRPKSVIPVAN